MLREKPKPDGFDVLEAEIKHYKFNKFLYQLVGEGWAWNDKDSFSDQQWREYAEDENLRTWVAYTRGSISGYFELERQPNSDLEITYFGLVPGMIGKGLGGYLLTYAIKSAWAWGDTKRIWLHTCSLDHASALNNYKARGFEVYRESSS